MAYEDRFWSKVDKSGECWTRSGAVDRNGYARFGESGYAHRVAWELSNGTIPAGMHIDHICHNRECVNPAHLRAVTQKQNIENHAGPKKNSKSGVRGVCWHPQTGKWRPRVLHDGVIYNLGLYADLSEAEAVVIAKRNELHSHNNNDRADAS